MAIGVIILAGAIWVAIKVRGEANILSETVEKAEQELAAAVRENSSI